MVVKPFIHLNSGTFTAPASFSETVEYVVIGGGGAGGGNAGGGGGAGAYKTGQHQFQDHHLQLSKLVEEVLEAVLNISLQILTPE